MVDGRRRLAEAIEHAEEQVVVLRSFVAGAESTGRPRSDRAATTMKWHVYMQVRK